ncbi:MAG: alpha/beta fold hydrolase [Candidatus Hodarchaeales archaeon]
MNPTFNEIEEKNIEVNNITLHTVIINPNAAKTPLILLHGFPDFWYGWKNVIKGLQEHFRIIIPDMRGYNLSDKPEKVEDYHIDLLVKDIKMLAEYFDLKEFSLIGHDWGGVVAWVFSERHPDMLKNLVILNAPHPKIFQKKLQTDPDQQRASYYIFKFLKTDNVDFLFEDDFRWLRRAVFEENQNRQVFTEIDQERYIEAWSQPNALKSGVNYYRANLNFDELSGIVDVPTLVIWGMKDRALLPSQLDGLSDYVKDLTVVESKNSSHWIMFDDPELIIRNIRTFMAK